MRVIKPSVEKLPNVVRRQEKVQLILDWLAEFRFSCVDILQDVIGSDRANTLKVLGDIEAEGMILPFVNESVSGVRLYCLGMGGKRWLENWGRDTSRVVVKSSSLARTGKLIHHICVQKMALFYMEKFDLEEVFWEANIETEARVKPDLMLRHKANGLLAAVEFDRTSKTEAEFYYRLRAMYDAIEGRQYNLGIITVQSPKVLERYAGYYKAEYWPIYDLRQGKLIRSQTSILYPETDIAACIRLQCAQDQIGQIFVGREQARIQRIREGKSLEISP